MTTPTKKIANGEFDWRDDALVVLPEQAAVAVHMSEKGDVVIRQKAEFDEMDDGIITIAIENIGALVDRLNSVIGKAEEE